MSKPPRDTLASANGNKNRGRCHLFASAAQSNSCPSQRQPTHELSRRSPTNTKRCAQDAFTAVSTETENTQGPTRPSHPPKRIEGEERMIRQIFVASIYAFRVRLAQQNRRCWNRVRMYVNVDPSAVAPLLVSLNLRHELDHTQPTTCCCSYRLIIHV